MKVKARNLAEMIAQALILVLTFIPGFYLLKIWEDDYEYSPTLNRLIPIQSLRSERSYSLFDGMWNTDTTIMIVGMALYAVMLAGLVLFVFQFISKAEKRNCKPTIFAVCLQTVLLIAYAVLIEMNDWTRKDSEYQYALQIMFYIVLLVMLATAAITILGYIKAAKHGIIEETPKVQRVAVVSQATDADELKKYKELFDQGVISEQEFEAKKKQILNI